MSPKNFKDFLTIGLCLQTAPDNFKVLIGPFTLVPLEEIQTSKASTFLYKAEFWDFLKTGASAAQNFVYKPVEAFDLNREEIIGLIEKEAAVMRPISWLPVSEKAFKEQFDWSQNLFKKGNVKKTVPVILQSSKDRIDNASKCYLLAKLLSQKNFGWTYAYFENDKGIIGHTPELLLKWSKADQAAQTVALAGTVSNTPDAKAIIAADPKIRQEHNYVIDDIEQKLSGFSAVKENTEVLELKHLLHLQTCFKIPMGDVSQFVNCVTKLHPTAAMGVYPYNIEILKQMAEFELQNSRGLFAGPLGVLNHEQALVVVPIRGLSFDSAGTGIYSGCGVTAASEYSAELAELENKRNSVKKMLGLTNDQF